MAGEQGIVVKAYLDSQEIRRFLLETSVSTNFEYLKQKAHHIFEIPPSEILKFCWKDADDEFIMLSSDEELVEALNHQKEGLFRLYVSRFSSLSSDPTAVVHANVVCDGCQGAVRGTRYKCTVCPDYDLCSRCEYLGKHKDHNMMCVRRPVNPCDWGFWRDFSQHMNTQMGGVAGPPPGPSPGPPMMGRGPPGFSGPWPWGGYPWQCRKMWKKAFKCHQKLQRENSRMRDSDTCGSSTGPAPTTENLKDKPEEGHQQSQQQSQPQSQQPTQQQPRWGETQKEFLKSMGEAVQSMLDPFGIDVSFSVDTGSSLESQSADAKEKPSESKSGDDVINIDCAESKKDETKKSPQEMNVDLDSSPSSPDAQRTAEFIVIDPDDVVETSPPLSQKVIHSLELMKRMGFKDNDGWLTKLLVENNGDIGKVLDIIQAKCKS